MTDPERYFKTWARRFALGVIAVCICLDLYDLADRIDWERIVIVRVTECGEVRR